jgi:hypothetical protein
MLLAESKSRDHSPPMRLKQAERFEIIALTPAVKLSVTPLWLWPNLLSLDAPLLAVLWQEMFARSLHANITIPARVILALTVWMIYAADRILDSRQGACETARHAFHQKYWRRYGMLLKPCVIGLVLGTAVYAGLYLEPGTLMSGIVLAAAVALYLALVHGRTRWRHRKECAVASVFAAGTALAPLSIAQVKWPDIYSVLLFAVLCWINCEGIEHWGRGSGSLCPMCRVLAIASIPMALYRPPLAAAVFLSSLALLALDRLHKRISPEAVRVLADVALLTPALALLFA